MKVTHAYVHIHEGQVVGAHVDMGDEFTGNFLKESCIDGDFCERLPIEKAKTALHKSWPLESTQ